MAAYSVDTIGKAMREVFSTPDGKSVLAWILSRCGMFETRIEHIRPELIALGNSILSEMEVGESGNMGIYLRGLLDSYESSDAENSDRRDRS